MEKDKKRQKKYTLLQRLVAAVACCLFLVAGVAGFILGSNWIIGVILMAACLGLLGPAAAESTGGFIEFFAALFELLAEGMVTLLEGIASIFSGLG